MLCYTFAMPLGAQLPVRLDSEIEKRLEEIAKSAGTTKSALIRLLAKTFVEKVVGPRGQVTLPPDWENLLKPADGRTIYPGHRPNHFSVNDRVNSKSASDAAKLLDAASDEEPGQLPKSKRKR